MTKQRRVIHLDSMCVQSFGTFFTEAEAVAAFDLGTILAFGTAEKSLNEPLTEYMSNGKFKQDVQMPPKVQESVQGFLNNMQDLSDQDRLSEHLSRIQSYFFAESCPFYDARDMA